MTSRAPGLSLWGTLLALLVLLGGVGAGQGGARADSPAPPAITVDKPSHDLGVVPEGPPAKHTFKVRNSGGSPLQIGNVSASCGCTAAAPKEKVIAPGKTGEIAVTFDTRGRPGKNVKTVSVNTNDPKKPVTTLTLNVEVQQLLAFSPVESFLNTSSEERTTQEAWLSGKLVGKARLKVAKVDPPGPIEVQLISRKSASGATERGLRFSNAPKQAGNGTVRVVLSTGLADPTEIVHLVRWLIRGNLDVPDAVYLDMEQAGASVRLLQVNSRRPDFRITGARVLSGPFKAELMSPKQVRIATTLDAPPATHALGKMLLESNDPLQPKKEVALSLEPRRAGGGGH